MLWIYRLVQREYNHAINADIIEKTNKGKNIFLTIHPEQARESYLNKQCSSIHESLWLVV